MTEYIFINKKIINGKKRKIYKKKGSKKKYLKYKGKMMNITKYKKAKKNNKTKKKGGMYNYINNRRVMPLHLQRRQYEYIDTTRLPPVLNFKPMPYLQKAPVLLKRKKVPPMPISPKKSPSLKRTSSRSSGRSDKKSSKINNKQSTIRLPGLFRNGIPMSECLNNGDMVRCNYNNIIYPGMCLNKKCVISNDLLNPRVVQITTKYPAGYPKHGRMPGHNK